MDINSSNLYVNCVYKSHRAIFADFLSLSYYSHSLFRRFIRYFNLSFLSCENRKNYLSITQSIFTMNFLIILVISRIIKFNFDIVPYNIIMNLYMKYYLELLYKVSRLFLIEILYNIY